MKKFWIRYGMGGGFGGCGEWEEIECDTEEDAVEDAWEAACEYYSMYEGQHGIRCTTEIMEEDDLDEADAWMIYTDERDSWIDYEVSEIKPEDYND